ncbi:MAG: hypothetical protein EXX96DRAFT_646069 [Benjaminiella poitrasii]|nr:MAG: hypothetical protein EXX96DRAFT_646069 [Benjaminiella poitrasii]
MMSSTTTTTTVNDVPISPPVTPKTLATGKERSLSPEAVSMELLPPTVAFTLSPHDPPLLLQQNRRKSNTVYRAIATLDKDVIQFNPQPIIHHSKHRSKSCPHRSLPVCTKGSFMMEIVGVSDRKRRNEKSVIVTQNQPTFDTVSILNTERHVKKAKTDAAAAYDQVDITMSDEQVFEPEWVPDMNALERHSPTIVWKGTPLVIDHLPYYDLLHPGEVYIASILRLTPEQYLKCKRALILAAKEFDKMHLQFRKSDAQKCARIDVNKTSTLWSVFNKLGWFNPH